MNTTFKDRFYKNADLEEFDVYMQTVVEWEANYYTSPLHDLEVDVFISKDSKKCSPLRNIDDPWEPSQK